MATAELHLTQLEQQRLEALLTKGAAAQEELDRARRAFKVARARMQVRQEQLALLTEGTRPEEINQARAQLAEAEHLWQLQGTGACRPRGSQSYRRARSKRSTVAACGAKP